MTNKPFAVNYIIPFGGENLSEEIKLQNTFTQAVLDVCIEEKVPVICAVGGQNPEAIHMLKEHGFTVVYRSLEPTVEAAKDAEKAGADIIVATGFDEGGCMPSLAVGTMESVSRISDAVFVPVMAAGGMVNARTTKAAFALGAEGIYAGTRFIACDENPAADACKEDIVKYNGEDTILIPAIKSYYRVTPHKKALELKKMDEEGATVAEISAKMGGVLKKAMLDGDLDEGLNIIDGAIGSITSIKSAADIVKDFFDGVEF